MEGIAYGNVSNQDRVFQDGTYSRDDGHIKHNQKGGEAYCQKEKKKRQAREVLGIFT